MVSTLSVGSTVSMEETVALGAAFVLLIGGEVWVPIPQALLIRTMRTAKPFHASRDLFLPGMAAL
jgi:hypothetical protein